MRKTAVNCRGSILGLIFALFLISGCGLSQDFTLDSQGGDGLAFFSVIGDAKDDAGLDLEMSTPSGRTTPYRLKKDASDVFFRFRRPGRYSTILALTLPAGSYSIPRYEYYVAEDGGRYMQGYPRNLSFIVTAGKANYLGQISLIQPSGGIKATVSDQFERDVVELNRVLPNISSDQIVKSLLY